MTKKFNPWGKMILVERIEEESRTPFGIIIPDGAKEISSKGIIVAVSKEVEENYKHITVSQKILFRKYKGHEVKIDEKSYIFLDIDDVLGNS